MKILCVGGGSGGHIMPNLALIAWLLESGMIRREDVLYVGSRKGMEAQLVPARGIAFTGITSGKLRRYWDWRNFVDPFRILWGTLESFFIVRKFQPDIVFSKGGFVSLPLVVGARLNRVEVVTHESDLVRGLANRIIGRMAKKICVTFPHDRYDPKEILTGVPLRKELFAGDKLQAYQKTGFRKDRPVLLIMGGSLGSQILNEFVWQHLEELLKTTQVVHMVGKGNEKAVSDERLAAGMKGQNRERLKNTGAKKSENSITLTAGRWPLTAGYVQYEFLDAQKLANMYALADAVLSRAGATAIVELAQVGKPMILVPLSTQASRGEQVRNALYIADQEAAVLLPEEQLLETGVQKVKALLEDEERLLTLSHNALELFPKNPEERIAKVLSRIIKDKNARSV